MGLPKLKKPTDKTLTKPKEAKWEDKVFNGQYPNLSAFLSQQEWEDGSTRQTGTMIIFVQDGQLKMCISDRDGQKNAFITAPTLQLLYDLAEMGLDDNALDWRTMKR